MVQNEEDFSTVLADLEDWMKKESLTDLTKFTFVTCGDWDLKTMLPAQCSDVGLAVPECFHKWINLKVAFSRSLPSLGYPRGLGGMLNSLNMQFIGRPHSGIDDCENIARILKGIAQKGYVFENTKEL